ncbi:MAG: AMP-binding protein [Chloroflexi bacterium]|nr:AMP-binding protein [Chloroflexota bacterium]
MTDTGTFTFGGDIVWRPSPEIIARSNLQKFMSQHNITSFDELLARSTTDVAWFTDAVLKFLDISFQRPYSSVIDLSKGIQWPQWCVGGMTNIAFNCVDKHFETGTRERVAIIYESEEGDVRLLTYGDLFFEVNRCANMLRAHGLKKGDAVGLFMPMTPEIVVALLAIVKIGGIVLPLFSGYGVSAIVSRLNDAGAKALFTADGFFRRGQLVPLKPTADEAAKQIPTLQKMFVFKRVGNEVNMQAGRDHWWHDEMPKQMELAPSEPTSAEDPLMIIYTSGTTGKPKGAVHTHCGFPVKAAQDMAFGTDIQPGDILYWMTDMGWMMGPWQVFGVTLLGATMFLYDGSPDYAPAKLGGGPDRLWSMVARHKVTTLGVSPTFIRAILKFGDEPVKKHDLSSLRAFASTGEPWNPDPWLWLFNTVGGGKLPIINYSGGTEISGGIVMGNPLLPLKPCAFSAPCPGIAADVFDENGQPVRNAVGELVIKAPWIGMTHGFWKDPQRYEDIYWSRWPNVWVHGDWAAIDDDGLWYILGRSDDTIKVAGKRLGPAEVESILVAHPAVAEAAAIAVPDEVKGNEVVCFCVLKPSHQPSDELREALKEKVAAELGKPLKPREIKFVRDLPKTRNAKVMRRIIRSAYLGQDPGDTSSLENPVAVEEIRKAA